MKGCCSLDRSPLSCLMMVAVRLNSNSFFILHWRQPTPFDASIPPLKRVIYMRHQWHILTSMCVCPMWCSLSSFTSFSETLRIESNRYGWFKFNSSVRLLDYLANSRNWRTRNKGIRHSLAIVYYYTVLPPLLPLSSNDFLCCCPFLTGPSLANFTLALTPHWKWRSSRWRKQGSGAITPSQRCHEYASAWLC